MKIYQYWYTYILEVELRKDETWEVKEQWDGDNCYQPELQNFIILLLDKQRSKGQEFDGNLLQEKEWKKIVKGYVKIQGTMDMRRWVGLSQVIGMVELYWFLSCNKESNSNGQWRWIYFCKYQWDRQDQGEAMKRMKHWACVWLLIDWNITECWYWSQIVGLWLKRMLVNEYAWEVWVWGNVISNQNVDGRPYCRYWWHK